MRCMNGKLNADTDGDDGGENQDMAIGMDKAAQQRATPALKRAVRRGFIYIAKVKPPNCGSYQEATHRRQDGAPVPDDISCTIGDAKDSLAQDNERKQTKAF